MNKRIIGVQVSVDQFGYVDIETKRRWDSGRTSGYYPRYYSGYGNIFGCVDRAFRRLVRIQALQLALFKKNQEQQ
jgi:hypothetical protein